LPPVTIEFSFCPGFAPTILLIRFLK
jgi:hypothetical protein